MAKSKKTKHSPHRYSGSTKNKVYTKSQIHGCVKDMLQNDPSIRKLLDEEAHKSELAESSKQAEDIDSLILMALHNEFGFGKKRLMQFAKGLSSVHKYYLDRYEDCEIFAVKRDLNKIGIDIKEFQKEVEKFYEDEDTDKG